MRPKSILILSGGLDSTVSSWIARERTQPLLALTFDYGQRAAPREIRSASVTTKVLGIRHQVIPLPWLKEITTASLVNLKSEIPEMRQEELDNTNLTFDSAKAVWIPNRNGIFLNIAAAFAESLDADLLVTGFNAEEGLTFPDNSVPFVRAADEFFWYSTLKKVKVTSFTLQMTKCEIARKGKELGIDFGNLWFCYEGGERPCRHCESCQRGFRAMREASVEDPWK